MFTATMVYRFKEDFFEKACVLWESRVMEQALNQPGFVRMQFLVSSPEAMAVGTWEDESYAQAFMKTGVFADLMKELGPLSDGDPVPRIWDLKYFKQST